jgi:hypothetical protein
MSTEIVDLAPYGMSGRVVHTLAALAVVLRSRSR